MVLLALVDADYKFIYADMGWNGASSDAGVFADTELKEAIEDGTIGFPEADPLPNDDKTMAYFIIGDDAFALRSWMMKPFSRRDLSKEERIFNYRLSRARRVVENAFGILSNRFRCLLSTMAQEPSTVTTITLACCCLHNVMRLRYPSTQNALLDREDPDTHEVTPGAWRDDVTFPDLSQVAGGNRATKEAKCQRIYLKEYYNSPAGAVPWQDAQI